jgi:hypothetical protein
MVEAWAAGGGGGSGYRFTPLNSTDKAGGGAGGGGGSASRVFKASDVPASVSITVGAGGSGGAAVTVDNTNGNAGNRGGNTTFGSLLTSFGGGNGLGGTSGGSGGGSGGGLLNINSTPSEANFIYNGGSGGTYSSANSTFGKTSFYGAAGGGGGGGLSSTDILVRSGGGGGLTGISNPPLAVIFPGVSGGAGSGFSGGAGGGAGGSFQNSLASNQTMCFGNSTFAYATTEGFIATSANGTTGWTFRSGPNGIPVPMIFHDGTKFVVFNPDGTLCWTTTDFVTWTERTGSPLALSLNWRAKYVNNNYFVMGTLTTNIPAIFSSTDLTTWTQVSTGITQSGGIITDLCWSGTNYVVTSTNTPFARYSPDLTTWTTPSGTINGAYSCESNGAGTVVIQSNGTPFARRSTDHGVTFASVTTTLVTPVTHRSIAYLNSTWFLSADTSLYTSTDGTTYTTRTNPTSAAIGGGFAYNGTTYALGSTAASSTTAAITAVPAALGTWTARTMTALTANAGAGGAGGIGSGGGGGGGSINPYNSGAGGAGGNGLVRVYTW